MWIANGVVQVALAAWRLRVRWREKRPRPDREKVGGT